ncbi:hypothetical protein ACFVJ4_14135 [Streptomyces sp. NPDC127178]|uniref:hypothetical protein n=1 Tax=unclassified Streptomyces TaxID=2593676 RepID=UPI0036377166
MAAKTPERRKICAEIAATERHHGPDDPKLPEMHRDLRAAGLEEHIRHVVDAAPPLTDAQRSKLAVLLLTAPQSVDGGGRL